AIRADLSFLTFHGSSGKSAGRIVSVDISNPSARAQNRIRASHYVFSVAGRQLDGVSYATGRPVSPGDTVTVEYLLRDPMRSRIEGMRRDRLPRHDRPAPRNPPRDRVGARGHSTHPGVARRRNHIRHRHRSCR
ncbi:MAG: hypothetical protein ACXVIJ_10720, partial [Thermoanaerobaculia bacterium]